MIAGKGPSTKKPGGGLPETLGELWIELRRRLCYSPKLLVRCPKPAVLLLPSDRCESDRSDNGWLPRPLPVRVGRSIDWRELAP